MADEMRAFIAVDVPGEIKKSIIAATHLLEGDYIRPVRPEQMHITLFFFERINDEQAERVKELLDAVDGKGFDLSLDGFGAFTPQRPHIIYVNVSDNGILSEIYESMKEGIRRAGLDVELRPFTPHLTVGRVKRQDRHTAIEIKDFINEHSVDRFGSYRCSEIKLIKSTLTSEGPVHEVLFARKLA